MCQPEVPVQIIGDLHGCIDALDGLSNALDPDIQVVCVGDYVDRGEASAQVLSALMAKTSQASLPWVCLRGNHEEMLINFMDDPAQNGRRWLRHGGLQTLASFRVSGVTETSGETALRAARDALRSAMPDGMEGWLRRLPLTWNSGNLWVVHAAADPEREMTDQEPETLVWGDSAFLRAPRSDGNWVAHGHTVVDVPSAAEGRIAVDTGAYFTGNLTAALCKPDGNISFLRNERRTKGH
ncbi:serine/threonine protein phosphatase [Alphaproteobacteria bacterium KMM 3653]|uniref:Serine/threonine protein phosphatase n=1 Tax=Harenicola maris TaxID=2841044 RepID=A0AAP2CPL9_9RHOB|nr:serine/threonine protein phosphatase [Harenicola maris]